jgi:hypothetical protein
MSTSYHDDRVKLTLMLHSGVIDESKTYLLKELNKYPIAYIIGGPKDIAYNNVSCYSQYTQLHILNFSMLFSY